MVMKMNDVVSIGFWLSLLNALIYSMYGDITALHKVLLVSICFQLIVYTIYNLVKSENLKETLVVTSKMLLTNLGILIVVSISHYADVLVALSMNIEIKDSGDFIQNIVISSYILYLFLDVLKNLKELGLPIPQVLIDRLNFLKSENDKKKGKDKEDNKQDDNNNEDKNKGDN